MGDAGHQGIDGVYYNPNGHPPYIISEAKYNTAKLGKTKDGKQMNKEWIDNRLLKAVGEENYNKIRLASLQGDLQSNLFKGTIYQFTPATTYCIYENIKKDDFRFGSRLFNFNSCSLLKSCAFYIIVGNFQGQFFHLKTTV